MGAEENPKLVIILSGKRKSGKDFIADILDERIQNKVFLRIAGPIKYKFAQDHGLNFEELMSSSEYKEKVREDMIRWSEEMRKTDPNCFLKLDIEKSGAKDYPVWILTDARRKCDVNFFLEEEKFRRTKVVKVRIKAPDAIRASRGWVFTRGVDDAESECGLDDFDEWDLVIENNRTKAEIVKDLEPIFHLVDLLT